MGNQILVEAGRGGGDLDGFIALMGRPAAFGYGSHRPGHVFMVEGRGDTGLTVELMWAEDVVVEVKLHGADGRVLVDITSQNLGFFLPDPKTGADMTLDNMMNAVQSAQDFGVASSFEFIGNVGHDKFTGGQVGDALSGGAGNDTLSGAGGDDRVAGGAGQDMIGGGAGLDRLTGGLGADTFVLTGRATAASGDKITDFSHADGDQIDLRAVDAMTGNATADHFTPITTAFTGTKGELRIEFVAKGALVLGDANGDAVADFMLTLLGVTPTDTISFYLT